MAERTCSIEGCEGAARARGWCNMHYKRWKKYGDPLWSAEDRFWSWVEATESGCLVWTGATDRGGYGRVSWEGHQQAAHRVVFLLREGRWPDGLLRHLCNNPPCVLHVVEGTPRENQLDRIAAGTMPEATKTHCVNGHEFTPENTYVRPQQPRQGRRCCRACNAATQRRRYRSRTEAS